MMEIRAFDVLSDRGLVSAWAELEEAGACPTLFVSLAWIGVWARHFTAGAAPTVLVGYQGGVPVGLTPLFTRSRGPAELPVNFLALRAEFLLAEGSPDDFVAAALTYLRGRGLSLVLRNLPRESPSRGSLERTARRSGYLMGERASRLTPFVDTTGTWDDYLSGVPKKRVTRWQRRVRKLEQQAGMAVRRFDSDVGVDDLIDRFIEADSRSWREERGTSISGRGLSAFYKEMWAALAEKGWLRPYWVEHEDRVAAFVLGAVHRGTYYALKTAYDEAYSSLSPGTCLFYEVIGDAFRAGLSRVDFLGEPARWKGEWATGHQAHVSVELHPANLGGLLKHVARSRVRPLVRKTVRGE